MSKLIAAAQWTRNLSDSVWTASLSDRTALVEHGTGRAYKYAELRDAVHRFAAALVRRVHTPCEVVALVCNNSAEFVVAYHGTLLAGGVVLPLEPSGSVHEWQHVLARCAARHVVADTATWERLAAVPAAASLRTAIVLGETGAPQGRANVDVLPRPRHHVDVVPWSRWLSEPPTEHEPAPGDTNTALLVASSGSLGTPKQIVLSHRNLLSNLDQIDAVHHLTKRDVVLGLTPFRHIYGMQMAMNPSLRAGGKLVTVSGPFTVDHLLEVVEAHRITVAYLVPSVLTELAMRGDIAGRDVSSLRLVYSGAAPLPENVAQTCARMLGAPIVQGYGMTEAGCTFAPPDGAEPVPSSIGMALPHTGIRLVDPESGQDGESGEIWVRGPQVSPGFLDEDGSVRPLTDDEGWLHTGDVARRSADGRVTITGRLKQLIKYKGHQVAPAELEEILLSHWAISDAAVLGVPDELAGEIPAAFVVPAVPVDLAEVTAYVANRVAPYKKIRWIKAIDAIPRSATGKAQVRQLKDQWSEAQS
ncbi:AMP-binding protein [Saccharopolyspora pogona]|uniref:AMP-binding protein n=1 Tax=Saccharopolyspora pogona TaxID=333966 RepID=UPI001689A914|nr:AMP-binding protein [Saccharopolyspora pogona]